MTYQQWGHHYQAFPEQPLIHPWQQEFGCPTPRPRSFSLGSRPPTSSDLMEVSSKRIFNPAPIMLPLDCNRNYAYTNTSKPALQKSKSRSGGKRHWPLVLFLLLAGSAVTTFGLWKLRHRTLPKLSNLVPDGQLPNQPSVTPTSQQQPYQQPQQPYHPLPPPPPALVPPYQQQQYAQPHWQQQQQQSQQHSQQHPQHNQFQPQQPPQQQPQQHQQYPPPEAHHYQQPHHYGYSYQQHANMPQHAGIPHQQQLQPPQHQHNPHHPEMIQHGEPKQPWMMDHMENPAVKRQQQQTHHQQHPHNQQQQHPKQEPEPVMSRQEERAKARSEARSTNPKKSSTKNQSDDDIWEVVKEPNATSSEPRVTAAMKLRLEPAQFSYSRSVEGSDGIIYITSFEDSDDVTVEIVEDS